MRVRVLRVLKVRVSAKFKPVGIAPLRLSV